MIANIIKTEQRVRPAREIMLGLIFWLILVLALRYFSRYFLNYI